MDNADRSDDRIQNVIDDGIERSRRETERSLKPVIQSIDGHRYSICHYCASNIALGRLFCSKGCSDDHEHERLRRKALGL